MAIRTIVKLGNKLIETVEKEFKKIIKPNKIVLLTNHEYFQNKAMFQCLYIRY